MFNHFQSFSPQFNGFANLKISTKIARPAFKTYLSCKDPERHNAPLTKAIGIVERYRVLKKIAYVSVCVTLFVVFNELLRAIWLTEGPVRNPADWVYYQFVIGTLFLFFGVASYPFQDVSKEIMKTREDAIETLLDASSTEKERESNLKHLMKKVVHEWSTDLPSDLQISFAESHKKRYIVEQIDEICDAMEIVTTRSKFQQLMSSDLDKFVAFKGFYKIKDGKYVVVSETCEDNALYFRGNLEGIRTVIHQVTRALSVLHQNEMAHGEVVARNVLICDDKIKLQSPKSLKTPEQFADSVQKDIYDLGAMVMFLATNGDVESFTLVQSNAIKLKLAALNAIKAPTREELQLRHVTQFMHLISLMMQDNKELQITSSQILQHPFIADSA